MFNLEKRINLHSHEKKTFINNNIRVVLESFIAPAVESVFLYVAMKYFMLSDGAVSFISSSRFIGMICALFLTSWLSKYNWRKTSILAFFTAFAAIILLTGSLTNSPSLFVICIGVYSIFIYTRPPFFTAVFSENYQMEHRGRLFSISALISMICASGIGFLFKEVLELKLSNYHILLICFSVSLLFSSVIIKKIPSSRFKRKVSIFKCFKLLKQYPVFAYILFVWFIFGLGNLWTTTVRMIYLADESRGLGLPLNTVMLLTVIIPPICRMGSAYVWAMIFDKINIVITRILLNVFIGAGLAVFFISSNITVMIAASIIYYIGLGGTFVVWNLWVTKIAPPDKIQEFMALHTFFTGVRGTFGPFLGVLFISRYSFAGMGFISGAAFLVSIIMLIPLIGKIQNRIN